MKNTSHKIVFFGNERLSTGFKPEGAPVLRSLIDAGYDVMAVIAHHEATNSRSARELEIEQVAKKHNIPVLLPKKPSEIIDQLTEMKPDIGVLVAYGKIVPQSIIDLFPYGIMNLHPSLLPLYRGSTPIETAMLDGAEKTGISIMGLVKEMDAGPIYAQSTVNLSGDESKEELTSGLLVKGASLILKVLPAVLSGNALPSRQDESKATFTKQIDKKRGNIDWQKPVHEIEREIRAFIGWPQSRCQITLPNDNKMEIIITAARIADKTASRELPAGTITPADDHLLVGTGTSPLEILRLKVPGKKEISAREFIRGYNIR